MEVADKKNELTEKETKMFEKTAIKNITLTNFYLNGMMSHSVGNIN